MIKVNDNEYLNYKTNIVWCNFEVSFSNNVRRGTGPFITFDIGNKIFIGLELLYSKKMFINTELNKKINIKEHISDITYGDENGCASIINGQYDCYITKTSLKNFRIVFNVICEKIDMLNISIDANIDLL